MSSTKCFLLITLAIATSCTKESQLAKKAANKWTVEKILTNDNLTALFNEAFDSTSYLEFKTDNTLYINNNFRPEEQKLGNWAIKNDSLVLFNQEQKQVVPIEILNDSIFQFSIQLETSEMMNIFLKRKN